MTRAVHLAWMAMLAGEAFAADNAECARCHRAIVESYSRTPMARSSGAAADIRESFDRAAFTHTASGFQYRIARDTSGLLLEFSHPGRPDLGGRKRLPYFVGSGATARSYLIADGDSLFQAPITYYTAGARWDFAPGYSRYTYPYLTRPIQPGCLNCHASNLAPVAGTQNRYASPPFQAGISCERCHGPGEAHIARGAPMINPAKLDPERRDSICASCHLSGEVRVMQPGHDWQSYRPGERLRDSMTVFVKAGTNASMRVTGHAENLAQSACSRAAGNRLWCGSCHDPHQVPSAQTKATWFRGKCLACHQDKPCRETAAVRTKNGDNCITCHMPSGAVTDAEHVVYTDHSIPRRPRTAMAAPADAELVAFGGGPASRRDLALAYAIAGRAAKALPLLKEAARTSPNDVEVLLYLAEAYRTGEKEELAIPLYERAIRLDANQVTAPVGLGSIRMQRGEFSEAIRLWQDALSKNAGLELVRTNLAQAQWRSGDPAAAQATLIRAIDINPGFAPPVDLLETIRRSLPGRR